MNKKDKAMLEKLQQERARLQRQIEALQNEVRGLDRAINLCTTDAPAARTRPKNVKATVIKIVEDAGNLGATVDEVLAAAQAIGVHLERTTVASTLSRLKFEGQLTAREGRYTFRVGQAPAAGWSEPVTAH